MAEAKLLKIKTQRSVLIEQIQRVEKFVNEKLNSASLPELEVRLQSLESYIDNFDNVQSAIEGLDIDETKLGTRAEIEELCHVIKPALLVAVRSRIRDTDIKMTATQLNQNSVINYPRIQLKTFAGEINKYLEFIESFKSLVHNNAAFDDLTKFHYLKGYLESGSEAERTVSSLEITTDNYAQALKLLDDRYNNKKIICTSHLNKIFKFKPITKASASNLRELIDTINSNLSALASLKRPTIQWDDLIVYIMCTKLDPITLANWNDEAPATRQATLAEMMAFLNKRCHSLDSSTHSHPSSHTTGPVRQQTNQHRPTSRYTHTSTGSSSSQLSQYKCTFCKKPGHSIFRCTRFLTLSPDDRFKQVETLKLCANCLRSDHNISTCSNSEYCRKCNGKHHTLIHRDSSTNVSVNQHLSTNVDKPQSTATSSHVSANPASLVLKNSKSQSQSYVILSTALVKLHNVHGSPVLCRALLDSASQINLMTESLAIQLGIKQNKCHLSVVGVGDSKTSSRTSSTVSLQSRINNYSTTIDVFILSKITGYQPVSTIDIETWPIPKNIQLADPQFHQSNKIDLLIGAEIFLSLLAIGQIRLADELPTLQNTLLGWIISGKINSSNQNYFCNLSIKDDQVNDQISDDIIERFWKLENPSVTQKFTQIEEKCEAHFKQNTKRNEQGSFIVKLPLKASPSTLGDSRIMALRRYLDNEKKRIQNHQLQKAYVQFMQEYRSLGHMQLVPESEIYDDHYFLPHHCVLKPESSSTKLRVVFDGSAKTTTGKSLNDILMVGPVVQNDLFSILIRFRAHKFVVSADVSKMYRQILIDEPDSHLQYIFWRDTPQEDLHIYPVVRLSARKALSW